MHLCDVNPAFVLAVYEDGALISARACVSHTGDYLVSIQAIVLGRYNLNNCFLILFGPHLFGLKAVGLSLEGRIFQKYFV